jgi:hypothetical protein
MHKEIDQKTSNWFTAKVRVRRNWSLTSKRKDFSVWLSEQDFNSFIEEIKTFGGSTVKEQFLNFWTWYL